MVKQLQAGPMTVEMQMASETTALVPSKEGQADLLIFWADSWNPCHNNGHPYFPLIFLFCLWWREVLVFSSCFVLPLVA